MYLQKGEKISMRNLLYGLMLSSGNDAAVAIAEAVSGDEAAFVELMNKKVGEIGAADTHLSNPGACRAMSIIRPRTIWLKLPHTP